MSDDNDEEEVQKKTFIGWFALLFFIAVLVYIVYNDVTMG